MIGNRIQLDFETDAPPEIVVETDVHHDSRSRFPVYAALGVPEIWRYDCKVMQISHLIGEGGGQQFVDREKSAALPMLTAQILTEMIELMRNKGELQALLAFDEWLRSGE